MSMPPYRIGQGYDCHALVPSRPLIIGGVKIPHPTGLLGHSDADVLLHAICDALLGALNLRDIGFHFPDTDPKYKGADSRILLANVFKIIKNKGYQVQNLDSTVILEKPKLNPHIPEMQDVISKILEVETDRISIKATTHEKVDSFGQRAAIKAYAVCLLIKL